MLIGRHPRRKHITLNIPNIATGIQGMHPAHMILPVLLGALLVFLLPLDDQTLGATVPHIVRTGTLTSMMSLAALTPGKAMACKLLTKVVMKESCIP